jgi:large subunit ribosomal protein L29
MKIKDIVNKKDDALVKELEGLNKKLQELRFKVAIREEKDIKSIKKAKKDIARINTILREREIERLESDVAKDAKDKKVVKTDKE